MDTLYAILSIANSDIKVSANENMTNQDFLWFHHTITKNQEDKNTDLRGR